MQPANLTSNLTGSQRKTLSSGLKLSPEMRRILDNARREVSSKDISSFTPQPRKSISNNPKIISKLSEELKKSKKKEIKIVDIIEGRKKVAWDIDPIDRMTIEKAREAYSRWQSYLGVAAAMRALCS
jgi:hypothetical protein